MIDPAPGMFEDFPVTATVPKTWTPPEGWRMDVPPQPNWKWDFLGDGRGLVIEGYFPKLTRWQRWSAWWWFGSKFTRLR